ncbi:XRE family transcriptional regulator [Intrasporangium oryzae NRRL B-24470]|uniref:XRE family transcriptional regulator n=1 Tax=Intrasporangium oryzae NRRL B-24470 TaxID=1386089 RepID=W9G163_9MICO|nr:helix-turn-helix transcriptional regulator [Intrasporangium oryzae]EWS99835.1 XRE family transcriptional regulator [Intrasporangium oryzae NRRL B-24470]
MSKLPLPDLGAYLREQRESAQLSLRQLADIAGISNPYLSQIERGLKRPSAEILQQIAKGLQVSAESLYVRAGILDERVTEGSDPAAAPDVLSAIAADPVLTDRQRGVLVDIYLSFVGAAGDREPQTPDRPVGQPARRRSQARPALATAPETIPLDTTPLDSTPPGPTPDRARDLAGEQSTQSTKTSIQKEN